MSSKKLKLTVCRTCVRDNPGEGIFENAESVEKTYRQQLKQGLFGSVAEIKMQNCFSECENFHCVQLTDDTLGFRFKKISSPTKVDELIRWVKAVKETGRMDLPESLIGHLIEPIKVQK